MQRLIAFLLCLAAALLGIAYAETDPVKNIPLSNLSDKTIDFGVYTDTEVGVFGTAAFSHYLGTQDAYAIEVNGGPKIFRLNGTYGIALNEAQRLKLSAERLDEKLDFDFSSGTVEHWDGQTALGAAYAYLPQIQYLQSLSIGGYVSHSGSHSLPDETIMQDGLPYVEQRRIAGANSENLRSDVVLNLNRRSQVSGGLDYDVVHFNSNYSTDNDTQGLGGHLELTEIFLPQIKLTLHSELRRTEEDYAAVLGWLLPSHSDMQVEIQATIDSLNSHVTDYRSYTTGIRFNIHFDTHCKYSSPCVYSEFTPQNSATLLEWTRVPAVRSSQVLSVADNQQVMDFLACPEPSNIAPPASGQLYTAPGGWSGSSSSAGVITFQQADFRDNVQNSGQCIYRINGMPDSLTLTNPGTGENVGTGWQQFGSQWICSITNGASQCHFAKH